MEHHLPTCGLRCVVSSVRSLRSLLDHRVVTASASVSVARSRASWLRAIWPAAMERRTSRESVDPSAMKLLRSLGHGGVEVERVGEVELAGDLAGAVEGDLLVLDREVSSVGSLPGVLSGPVGHEPGDRLGDQPLQRGDADAVRERRDLGVHERCCLLGQRRKFPRRSGGPARPRGHRTAPGPTPWQPVLQLHRRRDQCSDRVGGAADGEGELRDAELGHQRRAFAGNGMPVSPAGVIQVASSPMDSGGCCSAQVTAAISRSACARLAAAWPRARTPAHRARSRGLRGRCGGRCHA